MLRNVLPLILSLRTLFVLSLLMFTHHALAYEVNVNAAGKTVSASSADAGVKYLSFKAWSVEGNEVFSKTSNGASVTWVIDESVQDGRYKYEVTVSNIPAGSRTRGGADDNMVANVSTHNGSVLVLAGSIVSPTEETQEETGAIENTDRDLGFNNLAMAVLDFLIPAAHADIVQQDDVIVLGSQCVGIDCSNGEAFDFDTFRLNENNLRLHFRDSSTSASFPRNDWRITINDSNNGGNSYFGIDDADSGLNIFRLEAGAPSNSLYVNSLGNLGIGTSNPITTIEAVSGDTPTLRLNQNGSVGFSPQTWDLGGNEAGFFLRDASNGSALPFRVFSGAPTNSLVVNAAGNIGVGIQNPSEKLHVVGNAIVSGNLELGSSRYIKNKITDLGLEQAMAAFDALEPVMFRYNHSPDEQAIGFIAEDVPDLVATQSRKSLKPMDIIAVLTKVVQEQQKTIDELSGKIDGLIGQETNQESDR